jgi:hypothetical protein
MVFKTPEESVLDLLGRCDFLSISLPSFVTGMRVNYPVATVAVVQVFVVYALFAFKLFVRSNG